jgi:WD40 repeat protein
MEGWEFGTSRRCEFDFFFDTILSSSISSRPEERYRNSIGTEPRANPLCQNLFRCNSSSIHIFPALNPASPSPITTLTQSPAIDVIAVGHLDGTVRVVDIKDGEEVLKVRMEGNTGEGIVGVAFRMGE